jgi:phage terminase small subunit
VAEKASWTAAERMKSLQAIHDAQVESDPRTAIAAIQEANKMDGSHAAQRHQHSGANGGPIQTVDLTNMSDDDLNRLEALFGPLAGAAGGDDEADQGGEGEESI